MSVPTKVCVTAAWLMGACGGAADHSPPSVDAPLSADAPACSGATGEASATKPDGGNLFLESIHVDSDLQAALALPGPSMTRAIAFFENAQTPDNSPFVVPGTCNNLEATKGWPLYVGAPHVDLDVGALTVTGKNAAGDAVTITPTKHTGGTDGLGRPHDVFYELSPSAEPLLAPDSAYTLTMSGHDPVPATTFTDSVFVPHDFAISSPPLEDNGPLIAGTSFPVTWTPAVSVNRQPDEDILGLVWLSDASGKPSHVCVTLHAAGSFTIPGQTIAEYRAVATARGANPNKVILTRQAVSHRLARLPNGDPQNCRRIDMLGTVSWMQVMDVSAGP